MGTGALAPEVRTLSLDFDPLYLRHRLPAAAKAAFLAIAFGTAEAMPLTGARLAYSKSPLVVYFCSLANLMTLFKLIEGPVFTSISTPTGQNRTQFGTADAN